MSVLHVNFIYGVEIRYQTNSQKKKKKKHLYETEYFQNLV